jgi:hypothetical protein
MLLNPRGFGPEPDFQSKPFFFRKHAARAFPMSGSPMDY